MGSEAEVQMELIKKNTQGKKSRATVPLTLTLNFVYINVIYVMGWKRRLVL
jgi:hypothetical protein